MNSDWIELISIFNRLGIRYFVAGGHAVAFHGQPRFTEDLDIAVASKIDDIKKLGEALSEFGFQIPESQLRELSVPNRMLVFGVKPNRIDILNELKGLDFETAYANRVQTTFEGIKLDMISLDDLIKTKQATGRPKDLLDLEQLLRLKD